MVGPDVMKVRADLVREHLVAQLHEEARVRYPGDIAEAIAEQLRRPLDRLDGPERASALPTETVAFTTELARLGYVAREAETTFFEHAGGPIEWLSERLEEVSGEDDQARWEEIAALCAELANEEPDERPDPGPQAPVSWRVPGPGGHVRHYLAVGAAAERGPKDRDDNPRLPAGIYEIGELKRCWLFGFLMRCCEESAEGPGS